MRLEHNPEIDVNAALAAQRAFMVQMGIVAEQVPEQAQEQAQV